MTIVGVPREVKPSEFRVAVTPDSVAELSHRGVTVVIEAGAGEGAAIDDAEYQAAGAKLVDDATEIWRGADIVCKVKEPQPGEIDQMHEGQTLFTFLHLAGYPEVASGLCDRGVTAIGYETVETDARTLPLLAPMSEVAGRMAPQIGAHCLQRNNGGRGILLGGVTGVGPGRVVVLGAGNVGWNSATIAAGMGADVALFDVDIERLRWLDQLQHGRITTLASSRSAVARAVAEADLVIGAVLVAGGRAPIVVSAEMVADMQPGSVVVDVAVDQGGCIETTHETTHDDPTFLVDDVIHYGVGNIPGAVPRTSTFALANATLPYLVELAVASEPIEACRANNALGRGLNTYRGVITHAEVARALGVDHTAMV